MMTYRSKNEYCSINEYFVSHMVSVKMLQLLHFFLYRINMSLESISHLYIDRIIVIDFFKPFLHKYTLLFTSLN